MARRERPLNSDGSVVAAFAQQLRDLRHSAGNPSYRDLAMRAHYAATTLSEAAAGRRLPSLEVALAYVRGCGGDVDDWRQRWQAAARAIGVESSTESNVERDPSPAGVSTQSRRGPVRLAAAAVLLTGILVAVVLVNEADVGQPSPPPGPSQTPSVGDGADPKQSGCAEQATTIASEPVPGPRGGQYGNLELRYRDAVTRHGLATSRPTEHPPSSSPSPSLGPSR
jgi:hypothetical protein